MLWHGWHGHTGALFKGVLMSKTVSAAELLKQARVIYDSPNSQLSAAAQDAWRTGFVSGSDWMALALLELRGVPLEKASHNFQLLGIIKYSLASTVALIVLGMAVWARVYPLALLCIPAFYAVEVQMVFLFPIALDGFPHPFRESRKWTLKAGGTLAAMKVVVLLAAVMIFGGLLRQGFIRSWCLGCLAVVLWYEKLRRYLLIEEPAVTS